uniref:E3 ubiquitin-protein ligase hrd-1 n=1 Tax=Panagrolaimus superbus TaxID=310955 RepID=A0A914XSC5_9BILA
MENIESSITQLGQIFSQLAHLVQEQGEMITRIDSNVEATSMNVEAAHTELLRYFNNISKNRWLIIKMAARITLPLLVVTSFVCTTLTIANALVLKKQFYPAVVYITKNNVSMAVVYAQSGVLAYLAFTLIRYIFFGTLRAAEVEHATDRVWHAIMETCLAFAVFRDDFSPKFVIQFVILFFVKAFHWLAEDRVDYMERSPLITLTFHARILGISALLSAINSHFISSAYFYTMNKGASAQIVFGFEYAVLMTMVFHIIIKYLLHTHDLQQQHPWENKAVYMLYAELFINFLRCLLYFAFFIIMIKIHTFPLFAIRQFYLTIRSFQKALNDVIQSRRAVHAMNNLFPLASAEELTQGDATCIICREEMTVESGAKKLPCNHIFHPNCLRSWFQRQQTCPTCRTDILAQRRPNIVPGQNGNQQQVNNIGMVQQPQNGQQMPPLFAQILGQLQQQQRNAQGNLAQNMQQQQMPPPQLFPFMAHNFGFAPPQGPIMQMQQPQQNHSENQGTTAAPPTMPMPPLPFPGMLPMPPLNGASPYPFPQPPVFAGLSDEEISQMEGSQRSAVEARLQALSNISVLLDAAVLQFQQYLSVSNAAGVQNLVQQPPPPTSSATNASASTVTPQVSEQNIDTTLSANLPNDAPTSSTASARTSQQPNGHINSSTVSSIVEPTIQESTDDSPTDISPEEFEHQETIRRRRLQYFDGNN